MSRFPVHRGRPLLVNQFLGIHQTDGVTNRQTGTHARRLQASGRLSPCPLCGRDTDDKCRRSADLISCFRGERFSPPAGLRVGQVVTLEARRWAVLNLTGGFAGSSVILRPHVDRADFMPAARRRQKRETAAVAPVLRDLFARVRCYVRAALALGEFHQATAEDLRRDQELLAATIRHLQELRGPLVLARREDPAMARRVAAVDHWLRLVTYQARDLAAFNSSALGTPSADAVASLREVR